MQVIKKLIVLGFPYPPTIFYSKNTFQIKTPSNRRKIFENRAHKEFIHTLETPKPKKPSAIIKPCRTESTTKCLTISLENLNASSPNCYHWLVFERKKPDTKGKGWEVFDSALTADVWWKN